MDTLRDKHSLHLQIHALFSSRVQAIPAVVMGAIVLALETGVIALGDEAARLAETAAGVAWAIAMCM